MAQTIYTVVKGDTLSEIAVKYKTTVAKLMQLNPDIKNKDLIYIGQKLVISGDANKETKNTSLKGAKITAFGIQSKYDDGTLFATWAWDQDHTDHYEVRWKYGTGVGVGFIGNQSDVTVKQSTYSGYPSTATNVSFQVRPVSKKYKDSKDNEVSYWTAEWSTIQKYYFTSSPPDKPSAPTVTIEDYKLTANVNYTDANATHIKFQVVKNNKTIFSTGDSKIKTGYASYSCKIDPGSEYKVRCRAFNSKLTSEWSDYSGNSGSAPSASAGIYLVYALTSTSVGVYWRPVSNATGYEVEYTPIRRYFDSNPSGVSSVNIDSAVNHAEITGLTAGNEYFFRIRATNDKGKSPWTGIKSISIGEEPSAPTTWSSTSTAVSGDPLTLYWVHNSADESRQTSAKLELNIGGTVTTHTITYGTCVTSSNTTAKVAKLAGFSLAKNAVVKIVMTFANVVAQPTLNVNNTGAKTVKAVNSDTCYWPANSLVTFTYDGTNWKMTEYDTEEGTTSYSLDTSKYVEGTKIKWRVKTAGILEDSSGNSIYSDWSIQRTIDIYAQPTLTLSAADSNGITLGTEIEKNSSGTTIVTPLTAFPFTITATPGPNSQTPIGYYMSIAPTEAYETVDNIGNTKTVNKGEEVYSNYLDVSSNPLVLGLSANDVNLENNITYKITCTVSMNSGLTAENSTTFLVAWEDDAYEINAEIDYDKETCTAFIGPYAKDEEGNLVSGITLSVYRREFDGNFTEIATGLNNSSSTYVTDPHPSLDYAKYRVVGRDSSTGAINYYDIPAVPIGEIAAIIQWDEEWRDPDTISGDPEEEPTWSGSMLKLPYNIDISDKHANDVELIEYIGRKHPVSYYGTQVGHTATWAMDIESTDKETLRMLRRLAAYMGDVYVREPSGSGYWANVTVSFSQKHRNLVIPVSLEVVRVEGGK